MFLCMLLGLGVAYLDDLQALIILVISIPSSAISCLARPADNMNMKAHVVSPKYIRIMQSTKVTIRGAIAKVIVSSVILLAIHLL